MSEYKEWDEKLDEEHRKFENCRLKFCCKCDEDLTDNSEYYQCEGSDYCDDCFNEWVVSDFKDQFRKTK